MRRRLVFVAFLFVALQLAGVAHAEVVQYMSRHPLPKRIGHGFCNIAVPHFHDYPPSDPRLYRQVNGAYYFVGDPTPFGYDGPRYAFYGPHPVADASVQLGGPVYCYLRGPHYHWYAPPPTAQFEMKGGAYWYVGAYAPAFYADQPRFAVINDAYTPLVYTRPLIDVTIAPPAFRGEILIGGGPGWRPGPAWRQGPGWRGPPPAPGWRPGPGRRGVAVRNEGWHRGGNRGWGHGPAPAWRGGPPHAGWRGGPPHAGWRGGPAAGGAHRGWHGGPPPGRQPAGWHAGGGPRANGGWHGGAPRANGGGWHGGGPRAGGHNNGFHR